MTDVKELRFAVLAKRQRERRRANLPLLGLSDTLSSAAQEHSADMAQRTTLHRQPERRQHRKPRRQSSGFKGRSVGCLTKGPQSPMKPSQRSATSRGNTSP